MTITIFTYINTYNYHIYLVVSTPLKNMKVSWYDYSQYMESHKSHVPNHQSDIYIYTWRILEESTFQWPFQDPKLEVPTIYKAYVRENSH